MLPYAYKPHVYCEWFQLLQVLSLNHDSVRDHTLSLYKRPESCCLYAFIGKTENLPVAICNILVDLHGILGYS